MSISIKLKFEDKYLIENIQRKIDNNIIRSKCKLREV